MPTSAASGTQTAVIGTEHTLGSAITTPGDYVLKVDKAAMQSGDALELRIYDTVLSGGVSRVVYKYTAPPGAQSADDMIAVSVPIPIDVGVTFTLKQTAGTGRSYPWKVLLLP